MSVKLFPIHFTRAVDTSDKVRARLAASKSGIFPSWNGLQTIAGVEFVNNPADAEAVLLFQSLPFEFIWDNDTYDDPLPIRPRSVVGEVKAHRILQDIDLPILYLYTDLHMALHDTFVHRSKRTSVYDAWGMKSLDPHKFVVLHSCCEEDKVYAKWNSKNGLKIAREKFVRIDHDALYWTGDVRKPVYEPIPKLVYVGNSQHGKKSVYLSRFNGLHIYGGWVQSRKDKLPNAVFHKGVKYSDSFALMNRYWGHVITTSAEQMNLRSPYTKLVLAVAAGTLPIIDPRLAYYMDKLIQGANLSTLTSSLISPDNDIMGSARAKPLLLTRLHLIEHFQSLFAERFGKINMAKQIRDAVDKAKHLYMKE